MDQLRTGDPEGDADPDVAAGRTAGGVPGAGVPDDLGTDDLRRKIATQPVIEQAKGVLMGYYAIDAEQAFALLRRWSSASHVKVRDLCGALVEAASAPGPEPYGSLRTFLALSLPDTTSSTGGTAGPSG